MSAAEGLLHDSVRYQLHGSQLLDQVNPSAGAKGLQATFFDAPFAPYPDTQGNLWNRCMTGRAFPDAQWSLWHPRADLTFPLPSPADTKRILFHAPYLD